MFELSREGCSTCNNSKTNYKSLPEVYENLQLLLQHRLASLISIKLVGSNRIQISLRGDNSKISMKKHTPLYCKIHVLNRK